MDIHSEGKKLIEKHKILYKELIRIPEKRKIIYREEMDNNNLIGKPRFKEKEYRWPKRLLIALRNHLQELWNYFELYSYWLNSSLLLLLDYRTRNASKKSILFLLEKDLCKLMKYMVIILLKKKQKRLGFFILGLDKNTKKLY